MVAASQAHESSSKLGHGRAFGAVTIVNATATGTGCSLAVRATTTAQWRWTQAGWSFQSAPATDDALAVAVRNRLQAELAVRAMGASVRVDAAFPASRGLKTSSSAAAAMVQAAAQAANVVLPEADVERWSVQASRDAGVTLTGAYDDQVAVVRGGCHVTDNARQRIVRTVSVPPWQVALWIPQAAVAKSTLRGLDLTAAQSGAQAAVDLALAGDVAGAMTRNSQAYVPVYRAAGFPVDERPIDVALRAGALGAGLSGTGPAVAALFAKPVALAAVPGGTWHWTEAVP